MKEINFCMALAIPFVGAQASLADTVESDTLDLGGEVEVFDLVERADPGSFSNSFTFSLRPHSAGVHTIRLSNSSAWMPDIDCMKAIAKPRWFTDEGRL